MPNSTSLYNLPLKLIFHFCLFFAGMLLTGEIHAINNIILGEYNLADSATMSRLVIHFQQPLGYRAHFPQGHGQRIEINLRRLLANNIDSQQEIRDMLVISGKDNGILADNIRYEESDSQNGVLVVEFKKSSDFTITHARDNRSIEIALQKPASSTTQTISTLDPTSGLPVYVIHLYSTSESIDSGNQPALVNFRKHGFDVYVTSDTVGRQTRHILSLGYFLSHSLAKQNLERLKTVYPDAWLTTIQEKQRNTAQQWFASRKAADISQNKRVIPAPNKLDTLIERAKQSMIDKDYPQAIRYFTKILQSDDTQYHKESLELLGVARERNGQLAHAKAEYEEYLRRYPEGEDAVRVRQRLRGLLTARAVPKEKLATQDKAEIEEHWEMFGSFSQFYRNQVNKTDITPSTTTESSLASDIVISGRKKGLDWNQRFDFVANHNYNFLNEIDANEGNIYTLFYDLSGNDNDLSMRFGRQTHSSDGVLGRFDGLIVKKRLGTKSRMNFLAGYPVELSIEDGIRTNRQFYALSLDFESIFTKTDLKIYYIDQTNDGLTDRQAVGSEIQYIGETQSHFLLLDYDTFYGLLNQATFVGNWRFEDNSTLNIVADSRKSPLITANNAIIGQSVTTIDELRQSFTEEEIYQLAQDRTSDFRSLTIGYTTPLTDRYQLNTDLTLSKLGSTTTSGGVDGTTGTDTEYYLNLALLANGLFTDNDITILGMQYNAATTSDTRTLNFSSRFNINQQWRINPRFNISWRENDNGSERTTYKPRLLVNYRSKRNLKYDFELGYEYSETQSGAINTEDENYYVYLGYIFDF